MRNLNWVRDIIISVGVDKTTAGMIVERLEEEGVLHLGYGDADVDSVVETFNSVFNATKVSRQDRWAAGRLAKAHGVTAVLTIIQLLRQNSNQPYAPVVNNLVELENKFQSVLNFLRRNVNNGEVIQV